jgi:hypothetical protein
LKSRYSFELLGTFSTDRQAMFRKGAQGMRSLACAVLLALGGGVATAHATSPAHAQTLFPEYYPIGGLGITGAPYSARQTTVRIQTAENGQKFSTSEVSLWWRDAEGRTRQERLMKMPSGQEYRSIDVTDPNTRIRMTWSTPPAGVAIGTRSVTIWPLLAKPKIGPPRWRARTTGSWPNGYSEVILEQQQVNGIDALGLRITGVMTLGTDQNGHDLKGSSLLEVWVSPALGIVMREISDNPRFGRSLSELSDVVRGDPDPALFSPPAGYQVRDMRQNDGAGPN